MTKLTWELVDEIRNKAASGMSRREIAWCHGVATETVARIVRGDCWNHPTRKNMTREEYVVQESIKSAKLSELRQAHEQEIETKKVKEEPLDPLEFMKQRDEKLIALQTNPDPTEIVAFKEKYGVLPRTIEEIKAANLSKELEKVSATPNIEPETFLPPELEIPHWEQQPDN